MPYFPSGRKTKVVTYEIFPSVAFQANASDVLRLNFNYCVSSMFSASVPIRGIPVRRRSSLAVGAPGMFKYHLEKINSFRVIEIITFVIVAIVHWHWSRV